MALGAGEHDANLMLGAYMLSSLLAIGYLMPVVVEALKPMESNEVPEKDDLRRAPFLIAPPLITAIGCVVLFFTAGFFVQLLEGIL